MAGNHPRLALGLLLGAAAIRRLPMAALDVSISARSELWFYLGICAMPILALVAVLVTFRRAWVRVLVIYTGAFPLCVVMVNTYVNNLCVLQRAVGHFLFSECG